MRLDSSGTSLRFQNGQDNEQQGQHDRWDDNDDEDKDNDDEDDTVICNCNLMNIATSNL